MGGNYRKRRQPCTTVIYNIHASTVVANYQHGTYDNCRGYINQNDVMASTMSSANRTAPHAVPFRLPAVAVKLTCVGSLQKWACIVLHFDIHAPYCFVSFMSRLCIMIIGWEFYALRLASKFFQELGREFAKHFLSSSNTPFYCRLPIW